jgi:cytochrome c-type biogenesis protein CcmH/NrfF
MSLVIACASHLLVDLPLFGGPVVMVVGAVVMMARAERRRGAHSRESPAARSAARLTAPSRLAEKTISQ